MTWVVPAELADDGLRRRRLSGRGRSGKLQHHTDQYSGLPLYTVVTMDPNDEVLTRSCSHFLIHLFIHLSVIMCLLVQSVNCSHSLIHAFPAITRS